MRRRTEKQRQQGGWGGLQSVWCKRERGRVEERESWSDEADGVLELWWTCALRVSAERTVKLTGEFWLCWNILWFPNVLLKSCSWGWLESCREVGRLAEAAAFLITSKVKAVFREARTGSEEKFMAADGLSVVGSPWSAVLDAAAIWLTQRSAWPDYYLSAPLLSLKPSRARSRLLISAGFIAPLVKTTDKEKRGPHSIAEVAGYQPPSVRRPSMQVLPPHWRLESPRPLASGANLLPGASALTCEFWSWG